MITNIAKEALEKKHTVMAVALTNNLGDESAQRGGMRKLQVLCDTTGAPILDWIQAYCEENARKGYRSDFLVPASTERLVVIAEMKKLMEDVANSKALIGRSLHYQHRASNSLMNLAHHAKVPVLQWLMAYHSLQSTQPQPVERVYNCPNPNCNFTTTSYNSWVGHGPSRCLRKSERQTSLVK